VPNFCEMATKCAKCLLSWPELVTISFPSIPAFYASFLVLLLILLVVVVVVVVFAFIWLQINEARMCWIVLIGAPFATIGP